MPRLGPYLLYNYLYKSDRTGIKTPYKYWPFTGFYSLGKACREESDLMSIAEFITALESLTGGREWRGILDLLKARLGMEDDTEVMQGKTLKQVVKRIYSTARSRTRHGTNDQLLHDWSTTREMAESMARHGLVSCIDWVESNRAATELKDLTNSA